MTINRRQFLRRTSAGLAGAATLPWWSSFVAGETGFKSQSREGFGMRDDVWYGGLEPDIDGNMFSARPENPEMLESASIWLFEENGEFAFPRVGVGAHAARWESHRYDCNMAFEGGRILRQSARGKAHPAQGPSGRDNVLGAGGLRFECVEPFRKWRVSYEDTLYESTIEEQIRGNFKVYEGHDIDPKYKKTPVKWDVELTMVVPAWTMDHRPEKLANLSEAEKIDAGLMGFGWRIEQAFRGKGELTIDGVTRNFNCLGSRIHRQGVRPMGEFRGHCWQHAVFPDGRAFGHCTYPEREDGSTYNIAYIYQNGKMYMGRSKNPPFLRNIMPKGDDVSVEIETELGITRIQGKTTLATFHIDNPGVNGMHNQQSGVLYTWDDLTTYGMIERSSPSELCRVLI